MSNILYSFIFPVHNESEVLVTQLTAFLKEVFANLGFSNDFEVILVENGSSDVSPFLTTKLAQKYSFIKSIHLDIPSYGNAIKQGILAAQGDKVFVLNVDYFDIDFIYKASKLLDYLDIVIGSKTLSKSQDQRGLFRRLSTYFFNVFLRLVLNYPGTDTHGIKAFRNSKLLTETIKRCRTRNELFDTELVLRMTHQGAIFVDLPQQVVELRPTRYLGFRRLRSTIIDLGLALVSKYMTNDANQRVVDNNVVVDADDYGISVQVNQAILNEVEKGKVVVVSIMPNLVTPQAAKKLKQYRSISYSMHFNLLRGKPCSPITLVPSLVNRDGMLYPLPIFFLRLLVGLIKPEEIKIEFFAQYNRLQSLGINPQYINSEQHLHVFSPLNKIIESEMHKTTIRKVRSYESSRSYLSKKPFRWLIFTSLYLLCNLRFGSHGEFKANYQAKIIHPGTNYD
jgi:glycosyltransferase involved in cell wall biosynthesis